MDASAFAELLLQTPRAPDVVRAIGDGTPVVPDLIGPEIVSTLRNLERRGVIDTARAETALRRFEHAPLQTVKNGNLLGRAWELRGHITAYDACYVALAEQLGAPLVSSDKSLSNAPGLPVQVVFVSCSDTQITGDFQRPDDTARCVAKP